MARLSEKRFPADPKCYKLYEEIGEGVSATVYRALCLSNKEIVAIKVLDLEKCDNNFDSIWGEVRTMSLMYHPNLLNAHCSFTSGTDLWIVMPFLSGGSCLHIMRFAYPIGFEEAVIATLLREVLKALVYLHSQGYIHRDVKAGNILIGANGVVKLADFGVSACMFGSGIRQRARNSFVGTPCWMAPEVMEKTRYDFKADIWSFGITALELAHGHAPLSKYPPMKVVLLTLQNAPPGLDYDRDKRFSKSFREMIAACLVKDPARRPSAEKLLKHSFFKNAQSGDFLARAILGGLSPLGKRFREMKTRESELILQDQIAKGDNRLSPQGGYIQGFSGWKFDLDDLKVQAACDENSDANSVIKDLKKQHGSAGTEGPDHLLPDVVSEKFSNLRKDEHFEGQDMGDSLALSFPSLALQGLKECFDVCGEEISPGTNPAKSNVSLSMNSRSEVHGDDNPEGSASVPSSITSDLPEDLKGVDPSKGIIEDPPRDGQERVTAGRGSNLPILSHQSKENLEEKVVHQKGRFRITATDALPKNNQLAKLRNEVSGIGRSPSVSVAAVVSTLRHILQQTGIQKEHLVKLINHIERNPGTEVKFGDAKKRDVTQAPSLSARVTGFQPYIDHLQRCNVGLAEELHRIKSQNALLERELAVILSKKGGQKS